MHKVVYKSNKPEVILDILQQFHQPDPNCDPANHRKFQTIPSSMGSLK